MKELLQKVIKKQDLDETDAKKIVDSIEKNDFEPLQMAGLLCALESKEVSSSELYYLVENLMGKANTVDLGDGCVDVCGTGGDMFGTFNISTAAVFVLAGAGVKVAKHGNRSVSSKSGSFDVLQTLGIDISGDDSKIKKCFEKTGISFLFAPKHHPVFKNIGPIRQGLGIKTIFNMMGPLLNPGNVKRQLIGVYSPDITELMADVMNKKGIEHGMVVNGQGLDEITISGKTKVTEVKDGKINTYEIDPKDYGIDYENLDGLKAEDSEESAEMIMDVLNGEKSEKRDIVVLNSAAALVVAGKAESIEEGIKMAEESIDSGKALSVLKQVQETMG